MANCMQMSGVFVLNNSAVMNASLRFARKQALQFDHPAGHIYMPVALRESNYLAYIYAFRSRRVKVCKVHVFNGNVCKIVLKHK